MAYTIAVSGINAVDNPGPGTGIARSLKESKLDVRIVGLAYDAMEPGIYMDWLVDKTYILPYPSGDSGEYLNRLIWIHEREHIDAIIPALDVELPLYMSIAPKLAEQGVKMMIPEMKAYRMRDKARLPAFAPDIGLKTPEIVSLTSPADIEDAVKKLGFPMMIKGPFYEAAKVSSRDQAEHEFHALAAKWGFPVLAQKFVKGDEYNLVGLGDGTGADLGHLAIKKMMITKLGKIWTNVSIRNDRIGDAARSAMDALKWRGGYELELLLEQQTNEMYLIEINPRFPAWVYMSAGCGVNLPARMVRSLLALPFETHSNYEAGKMLIRYTGELIEDISRFDRLTTQAES